MILNSRFSLYSIFFVAFGGCLYGYNIGAMSGILLFVRTELTITHTEASLFVGSFLAGIAIVMPIMGYLADKFGRKLTLILATLTTIVSILFMAFADNIHALIIARFITGIAAGMLNITIPLYLTETLPEALRGRGTVAFQLCLCFGIFFATLMSLSFESASAWRSVFLIELIPAFIVFLNIFLIPESPRWLVSRERSAQALKALERIRTNDEAKSILLILQKNTTDDHQNPLTIFRKKRFLVPCLLTMFVASLNQLTGINVFLQYDATILSMVGFETHAIALWGSLLITGINFLITCVAIFLVDKIERRSLLRIGLMGILLSLTVATLATHFLMLGHAKALIITFALLGYIASFALGPGALIWTLLSEVLPTKIRSMGLAISLCVSSLSGAVFSSVFLGLENKIGLTGIFFLCAMLSFIYGLVTFLLPATKGKSLEDIEKNFLTQPQK